MDLLTGRNPLHPHPFFRWALGGLTASALSLTGLAAPAYAADEPTLIAGAQQELTAALGDTFSTTLSVTNTGSTAIDGVAVTFATDWGYEDVDHYSNCEYRADQLRGCVFDQTLAPGASYQLVLPYRVRTDTYAPGGIFGQFGWEPAAGHPVWGGTPGTGGTLSLQAGERLGQSDDPSNWQVVGVKVTGDNGTDLVALGTSVSGTVGDVVNAVVGVRNAGPATLDRQLSDNSPGVVVVTLPEGTAVDTVPSGCSPIYPEQRTKPGTQYLCSTATLFKVGATKTWTFPLRIALAVPGAVGSVEVNPACDCDNFAKDLDKSNNEAALTLSATGPSTDTVAPVIQATDLVAGKPYRPLIDFRPTVTDNVAVTKLEATVSTAGETNVWGSCKDASKLSPGLWICKASTTSKLGNEFDSDITLRASDAAGNVSEPVTVRVHVDNIWPRFSYSPADYSSMKPGPVTIALKDVPDDLVSVTVTNQTTAGSVITTLTSAPWEYTWDAKANSWPCYHAVDKAGNAWDVCSQYNVDGVAPVINQVDFTGGAWTNRLDAGGGWVGASGSVSASISDSSRITRTEWRVNGVLASTSQNLAWDARAITTPTATVELSVWDEAGNTSSKSFVVSIDKAVTGVTVLPAQNKLIRGKSFVTSITVNDPHGKGYSYLVAPVLLNGSRPSAVVAAGKDGVKTVIWQVSDQLGNVAQFKRTVIVDNTAPSVAFRSAPANRAKVAKTFGVTASSADKNGVARVELLINGKRVATDYRAGYAFSINPKKYGKSFTVQLRSYDKAGNVRVTTKRTYRR
ncbi:Ig-like domain-containing protein [Actinoplanes sp. HUAS TT8]|uniref:Ig-like domain-containing protein n=1 Tax=Actinoplanes sp. HUAS TT8 TaxID=3447453 RepID=UPI003F527E54